MVYIGNLAQGRVGVSLYQGVPYHQKDKSEWDVVMGTHEPIISMELWDRVQALNTKRSNEAKASFGKYADLPKRQNPYGSLLRCADCGRVIKQVRSYRKTGNKDYYTYKCPQYIELGEKACAFRRLTAEALDQAVLETMRKQMDVFLEMQTMLRQLMPNTAPDNDTAANRKQQIREELDRKRNLGAALYTDFKDGILSPEEYVYAKEKCKDCFARFYCSGGCAANAFNFTGDINGAYDIGCELQKKRIECAIMLKAARAEAERLRQETEKIRRQSEEYSIQLQKEKDKAMEAARREAQQIIEDARRTANAAAEELKQLRKQLQDSADTAGINQRQAELRRSLNEAKAKLRAQRQEVQRPAPKRNVLVGDTVELLKLGTKASVIAINKDGTYQLQAGILKMNAKPDEVYLLEDHNPYKEKGRPAHSGREMKMSAMSSEVDLRGMDSVEAICALSLYLDSAMRSNLSSVRIIHGKGTGALRAAVHQELKKNKFIKSFRLGVYGEGEDGVTIAEFR